MNKSPVKAFRDLCFATYAADTSLPIATVVENLLELSKETLLKPLVAEGILAAIFVRKYDSKGNYITTLAPSIPKTEKLTIEPDFEFAATLTKTDLLNYAAALEIELSTSDSKKEMLADFQSQWEAK